ncbi:F0F1 ATP synthase subunit B [Candidatus Uhrbacteria bacterium]|nr:F0F1 ATP synthase subunit B [Candidatus Uhrbacteria bacterium]
MSQEIQQVAQAAQEVAHVTESSGGIGTLGINLKIFIAQLINFSIVLLVLWKWAYTPVVRLLEERQEKITKGVKQAEEIEKRILALEKEQEEILNKAKSEAAAVLDNARSEAQQRKDSLLDKTKEEIKEVIAQGKLQLQREKEQMIRESREEIASIAVEATRKILSETIDEKKSQKLAEQVIDSMSK